MNKTKIFIDALGFKTLVSKTKNKKNVDPITPRRFQTLYLGHAILKKVSPTTERLCNSQAKLRSLR